MARSEDFKMTVVSEIPARSGGTHGSPVIDPILEKITKHEGKWVHVDSRDKASGAGGLCARLRLYDGVSAIQRADKESGLFNVYAGMNIPDAPAKRKRNKSKAA